MDFVDNCYLIKHAQGWMLWDTGVTDAIAAMPDGQAPADPQSDALASAEDARGQLEQLGVKPADIKFIAVSHTHPDHIGNVEHVPEGDAAGAEGRIRMAGRRTAAPRFKPEHPVTKLEGDHDVFGDGSVTIISTPGHTPGHQSLLVKLPQDRRGAALGRRRALQGQLGQSPRAGEQYRQGKDGRFDADALPRSSPRKRRSSGSTTTRRSATR